jgi:cytochrome c oxidase assembly factor CtaG
VASVMFADLVSPAVHFDKLVTAWQFQDPYAEAAFAFQVIAAGLYLWAVVRLRHRSRRWPWARSVSFLCGIFVLNAALVSGLASYDDQDFSVHVVQHLAIMMLAPPLLSLGAPVTLAMQASNRRFHTGIIRVLHSPVIRALTTPIVAGILYYGSMYFDLLTPFYRYSLEHDLAHNLAHVLMFAAGCVFWWPMIGADRLPNEPSVRSKVVTMAVGTVLEVILGVALIERSTSIAPQHTLSDTRAGGAIFLVGSIIITIAASAVILVQWLRKQRRRTARAEASSRLPELPPMILDET